jgi:hypothetical protein
MAYRVNRAHFVFFKAVTGLTLSNFTVVFLIDSVASTPTLSLTEVQPGLYCCKYTPTLPGFYYLELKDTANSIDVVDTVEIDSTATFFGQDNLVELTQNYGSTNKYKFPTSGTNPELKIFKSTDWVAGNTSDSYVVNSTALDSLGNWVTSSIFVTHDTYHLVVYVAGKVTQVIAAFLVV